MMVAVILFSGFVGLPECWVHGDNGATVTWTTMVNRLEVTTESPAMGSYQCVGLDLDGKRKVTYGRFEMEQKK